jgi:hypothetical protein
MKCIECNNEFNSVNNRGVEQKYCSLKCRNKSAFKRREQRLKNTYFSPLDNNNNEPTGYDQMIIPCDFNGIVDDELNTN